MLEVWALPITIVVTGFVCIIGKARWDTFLLVTILSILGLIHIKVAMMLVRGLAIIATILTQQNYPGSLG